MIVMWLLRFTVRWLVEDCAVRQYALVKHVLCLTVLVN